jgi:hypothetical protein
MAQAQLVRRLGWGRLWATAEPLLLLLLLVLLLRKKRRKLRRKPLCWHVAELSRPGPAPGVMGMAFLRPCLWPE